MHGVSSREEALPAGRAMWNAPADWAEVYRGAAAAESAIEGVLESAMEPPVREAGLVIFGFVAGLDRASKSMSLESKANIGPYRGFHGCSARRVRRKRAIPAFTRASSWRGSNSSRLGNHLDDDGDPPRGERGQHLERCFGQVDVHGRQKPGVLNNDVD